MKKNIEYIIFLVWNSSTNNIFNKIMKLYVPNRPKKNLEILSQT